jgi:hypothetical protein
MVMALWRWDLTQALFLPLSFMLAVAPVSGAPSDFGTVVSAQVAHIGIVNASVGTTIFAGDQLSTEQKGDLQVRAGSARFFLPASSRAIWGWESGHPAATLTGGTGIFSTANSNAFVLHAGLAILRAKRDEPTVGSVTLLNPKELVVRCSRGVLTVAVDDDVREVAAGTAYHVVLDPNASSPPLAVPVPARRGQNGPIAPGKSKFIWYAVAFVAAVTAYAVSEALESEYRP